MKRNNSEGNQSEDNENMEVGEQSVDCEDEIHIKRSPIKGGP